MGENMKEKRKNKRIPNGFTMIELLATLVIIAIISTLAITAISSNIQQTTKKIKSQNEKMIQEASLSYIKEFGNTIYTWKQNEKNKEKYYCLSIAELINTGYLKENIIDENIIKDSFIKITQNIDNKTYKISELVKSTFKEIECN